MRALVSVCFVALPLLLLSSGGKAQDAVDVKPIPIEYVAPTNPVHLGTYETLKSERVLEKFQQILSIFPMSKPFGFKLAACDGEANAWYDSDDLMITVCYEYVEEVTKFAPRKVTRDGISPDDVVVGSVVETFLHEAAHALFDVFEIPILGREEDAADQVAAFILLQLSDKVARRMVGGVAQNLAAEGKRDQRTRVKAFSDEHGLPQQRFYNLLCMAYGAKPQLFSDFVKKGYLPKERAEGCEDEYEQVEYAVSTLLGPHMDKPVAAELKAKLKTWKPAVQRQQPPRKK
jgi:hypothetical protein